VNTKDKTVAGMSLTVFWLFFAISCFLCWFHDFRFGNGRIGSHKMTIANLLETLSGSVFRGFFGLFKRKKKFFKKQ
jgi:hypothetical protein